MTEFMIFWEGTVVGTSIVEADTLEEAMQKAEDSDDPIEIEIYPSDWEIDKDTTKSNAYNE